MKRTINLANRPAFSDAVVIDRTVYLSGQIAIDSEGNLVGAGDPVAQAEQCFHNIEQLLATMGGSLADIVILRCFLTDPSAYSGYATVKQRLFTDSPPAGTAVVVAELLVPGALFEVEATAVLPSQ